MPPTEEEKKMSTEEREEYPEKSEAFEYMCWLMFEENYPRRKARRKAERLYGERIDNEQVHKT